MRPPLLLLALLVPCLLGCKPRSPLAHIKESPERDLRMDIRELRAKGFLRKLEEPEVPAESAIFFARLDEIDAWLDMADAWETPIPDWLENNSRRDVLDRLKNMEPFFEQMTALLGEPYCVQFLAAKRPLAYRTSIRQTDGEEFDVHATPSVERMGRWVDLLCADAMMRAGETVASERTILSLSQAFDLLRLLDDGQLVGSNICAELETIVLLTLRRLAPGPRLDPILQRAAFEPRLEWLGDERRVWTTLRNEVSYRIEIAEVLLSEAGRDDEDHWLSVLDVSRARLVNRTLDVIYLQDQLRQAAVLCSSLSFFPNNHPLRPLLAGVRAIHTLDVYAQLARLSLAINQYRYEYLEWPQYASTTEFMFDGNYPSQPCRTERMVYDRGYNWVKMTSASRSGRLPKESDSLLVWSWPSSVFKQFEERDDR